MAHVERVGGVPRHESGFLLAGSDCDVAGDHPREDYPTIEWGVWRHSYEDHGGEG